MSSVGADPSSIVGHHDGEKLIREIPWHNITSASLGLQTIRFRFPGAFSGAWGGLSVALTQTDPGLDVTAGAVHVLNCLVGNSELLSMVAASARARRGGSDR